MKPRLFVLVAIASAIVGGCSTTPPGAPVNAAWARCDTAAPGNRCDVRVFRDSSGPYRCDLGTFRVEPDFLELTGRRPVHLQWELPEGLAFCDRDGIDLKSGYEAGRTDVYENFGSDGKDGGRTGLGATGNCRPFRNLRWGNTNPGSTHAYEIRFSNPAGGGQCRIDPYIRNG